MYHTLKWDLLFLVIAVIWFLLGIHVLKRAPLVQDPLVAFGRYHPRLMPLMAFVVIVLWPFHKFIWGCAERVFNHQLEKRK